MFIFDLLGWLVGLAVVVIIIGLLSGNLFYVVKQQGCHGEPAHHEERL